MGHEKISLKVDINHRHWKAFCFVCGTICFFLQESVDNFSCELFCHRSYCFIFVVPF